MPKLRRTPSFWQDKYHWKSLALLPFSKLYLLMLRLDQKEQPARKASLPVWCVGNVSVGGSGKTPLVIWLVQWLIKQGHTPHLVLRGYGGTLSSDTPVRVDTAQHDYSQVGDEALLLARYAPTWIAMDRLAASEAAYNAGASMVLLDDGMQHWRLHKDVNIMVVDGGVGIGNGYCLPAGPLREPLSEALIRADAVVHIGDHTPLPNAEQTAQFIAHLTPLPKNDLPKRVVAFAGIGRPEKFFQSLSEYGIHIIESVSFPDHHAFSAEDITALQQLSRRHDAPLITTEKDWVRLPDDIATEVQSFPVNLVFEAEDEWENYLQALMPHDDDSEESED